MLSDQQSLTWSGGAVLRDVIEEATKFCANDGKEFVLIDSQTQDAQGFPVARYASATVKFKCE